MKNIIFLGMFESLRYHMIEHVTSSVSEVGLVKLLPILPVGPG